MDERLLKIHTLIGIIKDAEAELETTMNEGTAKKERKPQACSKCGSAEHNARNCTLPANEI